MTPFLLLTTLSTLPLLLLALPSTQAKTPAPVANGCSCPTNSFNKARIFDDSVLSMRDFIVYGCCPNGYDIFSDFVDKQITCTDNISGKLLPPIKPQGCVGDASPCPNSLVEGVWKELWGCCVVRGDMRLITQMKEIEAAAGVTSTTALSTMQTSPVSRSDMARHEDRVIHKAHTGGVVCTDPGTYPVEVEGWEGTDTLDGKRVTACCKDGDVLAPYLSNDNALQCASLDDPYDRYLPPFPANCGKGSICPDHPPGCCTDLVDRNVNMIRKQPRSIKNMKVANLTTYPTYPTINHTLLHPSSTKTEIDGVKCPDHYVSSGTEGFKGTGCLDRQVVYACCPTNSILAHELSPWKSLMCIGLTLASPGYARVHIPYMPIKCLGEAMVCDGYPRACCVAY